jgi:hypothetical protein
MIIRSDKELHLVPASKQSTNMYDIYLILCVQSCTPDDGWKDHPKHVEWYSINSKIVHLVVFTTEIYNDARSHERQTELSFVCVRRPLKNSKHYIKFVQ